MSRFISLHVMMTYDGIKESLILSNSILDTFWNAHKISNKKLQMFFKENHGNQKSHFLTTILHGHERLSVGGGGELQNWPTLEITIQRGPSWPQGMERLTNSPVMHLSPLRTPLILCGVFIEESLFLPSQCDLRRSRLWRPRPVEVETRVSTLNSRRAPRCALFIHTTGKPMKNVMFLMFFCDFSFCLACEITKKFKCL